MIVGLRIAEIITYRAPLALAFVDAVTGHEIAEGLSVRAWLHDADNPQPVRRFYTAEQSPKSGIYGFRFLPGLERYQIGDPLAPGSLHYVVQIEDQQGRYLPQTQRYALPLATPALQMITLFSRTTRPTPPGFGTVRGELLRTTIPSGIPPEFSVIGPARWASVVVSVPADEPGDPPIELRTFADSHGSFALIIPYPLIPAGTLLNEASWELVLRVEHSPAEINAALDELREAFSFADEAAIAPFQATLAAQTAATLFDTVNVVDPVTRTYSVAGAADVTEIEFALRFGVPHTLRTQIAGGTLSEFLIQSI